MYRVVNADDNRDILCETASGMNARWIAMSLAAYARQLEQPGQYAVLRNDGEVMYSTKDAKS